MDISAAPPGSLIWDVNDPKTSLDVLFRYVVGETQKSIDWYWDKKRWPSFLSRLIQFSTVILAGLAGILPVLGELGGYAVFKNGMWSALFVGIGGALFGLDKAFGYSTAWARYVTAATTLRGAVEDFRMTWIALLADFGPTPSLPQIDTAIKLARRFHLNAQALVSMETQAWTAEFQTTKVGQERAFATQFEKMGLTTEPPPESWGRGMNTAAEEPGSIELSLLNSDKVDNQEVQIRLDGATGKIVDETLRGSKTWTRLNIPPGHYRLSVSGKAATKPVESVTVVIVKPGEVAKPTASLPL